MTPHSLRQRLLLVRRAKLKELLDDVVAEDVRHEAVGGLEDLLEDHRLLRHARPLQLLLDEPAGNTFDQRIHHTGDIIFLALLYYCNVISISSDF